MNNIDLNNNFCDEKLQIMRMIKTIILTSLLDKNIIPEKSSSIRLSKYDNEHKKLNDNNNIEACLIQQYDTSKNFFDENFDLSTYKNNDLTNNDQVYYENKNLDLYNTDESNLKNNTDIDENINYDSNTEENWDKLRLNYSLFSESKQLEILKEWTKINFLGNENWISEDEKFTPLNNDDLQDILQNNTKNFVVFEENSRWNYYQNKRVVIDVLDNKPNISVDKITTNNQVNDLKFKEKLIEEKVVPQTFLKKQRKMFIVLKNISSSSFNSYNSSNNNINCNVNLDNKSENEKICNNKLVKTLTLNKNSTELNININISSISKIDSLNPTKEKYLELNDKNQLVHKEKKESIYASNSKFNNPIQFNITNERKNSNEDKNENRNNICKIVWKSSEYYKNKFQSKFYAII